MELFDLDVSISFYDTVILFGEKYNSISFETTMAFTMRCDTMRCDAVNSVKCLQRITKR